ncbi:hypothetical protein SFR_6180 [Streptomyces sp. FR-008]|nr:hypothetical protein SFR_6180 [Streptomyces sp. FR-008]
MGSAASVRRPRVRSASAMSLSCSFRTAANPGRDAQPVSAA